MERKKKKICSILEHINKHSKNGIQILSYKPDKNRLYSLESRTGGRITQFMKFNEFYHFMLGIELGMALQLMMLGSKKRGRK